MKPKEKAIELVDKYLKAGYGVIEEYVPVPMAFAKQCALLAIDEIMSLINRQIEHFVPHFVGGGHTIKMPNQEYQYWQEVKQEIEAL